MSTIVSETGRISPKIGRHSADLSFHRGIDLPPLVVQRVQVEGDDAAVPPTAPSALSGQYSPDRRRPYTTLILLVGIN